MIAARFRPRPPLQQNAELRGEAMAAAYFQEAAPPGGGEAPVSVTVYSLPFCARSIATTRALAQRGVAFAEIDLSVDAEARAYVQALGYMRAPVVVAGAAHWVGHNPEAIGRIAVRKARLVHSVDHRVIDAAAARR